MDIPFAGVIFILGAAIGSFLNVCIYRLPRGLSVITPSSHCPFCKTTIKWYANVPLFGYIFLGGKCRYCHNKISFRYPFIELITGLVSVSLFKLYGLTPASLIYFILIASLIVVAWIDMDFYIIPDTISLPGIVIGFLSSVFILNLNWLDSLVGILLGGGSLLSIALIYKIIRNKEGMGMGDVKLLAMIGAFLGWRSIIFIIIASSFLGSIIGAAYLMFSKEDSSKQIPFGPFISIATILYIFFGKQIINSYINYF